ncbi:MAG: class I SAM-dependent methyltransferase [Acidimicrobiales bacterium]
MTERSAFAGGDQTYLRDVQYGDPTKLDVRTALHRRFSTATTAFPDFAAGLIGWSETAAVIECGTGAGRFWENTVTPRAASLMLTDLSPGMVRAAVALATAEGFAAVAGRECDVQSLPFDDGTFDVAVANHMLYHVPDPDRAVAEAGPGAAARRRAGGRDERPRAHGGDHRRRDGGVRSP